MTCRHCGDRLTPEDSETMDLCRECEAEMAEAERRYARHGG